MDELRRTFYGVAFERSYLRSKGDSFQDFFSSIMEKRRGSDFTRLRPWGPQGDRKNDGHLSSSKTVFQCYAPNKMEARKAIAKIEEDFDGAVAHWLPDMEEWVFVHNAADGLGPDIHQKLLDLRSNPHGIRVIHWGLEELREQAMDLSPTALSELFGSIPTANDFIQLGFEDLRAVIESIETRPAVDDSDVRAVPPGKLEHNSLSPDIGSILQRGMTKCDLVGRYLESIPDATMGDRLAQQIRQRYDQLRGMGRTADEIFFDLEAFVGGSLRTVPRREVAIYSILAYFFEQCDIFERPPERSP